jgi:hypothetical protein
MEVASFGGPAYPLHHKNAFSALYQTAGPQSPKHSTPAHFLDADVPLALGTRGNARSERAIQGLFRHFKPGIIVDFRSPDANNRHLREISKRTSWIQDSLPRP